MNEHMLTIPEICAIGIGVFTVLLVTQRVSRWFQNRNTEKTRKENLEKRFLEAALDEDPKRSAGKVYTWEELQRDLHDGKLTFDEIWEKAGGIFPERPKEKETSPETQGNDARAAWLQAWFKVRAEEMGVLEVVSPPPPPPVTVNLKGQAVTCPQCSGSGRASTRLNGMTIDLYTTPLRPGNQLNYHESDKRPARPDGSCAICGGKGYMIITGA